MLLLYQIVLHWESTIFLVEYPNSNILLGISITYTPNKSIEPSSTNNSSKSAYVCAKIFWIHLSKYFSVLYTGTITEIFVLRHIILSYLITIASIQKIYFHFCQIISGQPSILICRLSI